MSSSRSIEKLGPHHPIEAFDCGQPDLNNWLLKHALQNQGANAAQTYVGLADGMVVGYYSLAVGQVEYAEAPERLKKGLARHPVPIMLLARLAVHKDWQRKGVGRGLLKDAVLRTIQAAESPESVPWRSMQKMTRRGAITNSSILCRRPRMRSTCLSC